MVSASVPASWRLAVALRDQLPRFLFEPDDLIAVVGQNGLVPNAGKYLDGQPVFGICPDGPGTLCPHPPAAIYDLVGRSSLPRVSMRSMVEACSDDG